MIQVRLTGQLKDLTNGTRHLELESAEDVQSMVWKLDATFPGIGQRIMDDQDKIREHVNIFVNNDNSRDLKRERTRLKDGDIIHILPSVSGG